MNTVWFSVQVLFIDVLHRYYISWLKKIVKVQCVLLDGITSRKMLTNVYVLVEVVVKCTLHMIVFLKNDGYSVGVSASLCWSCGNQ